MTYLVTGAAGFIASTLVERLLSEDKRVVGVDCFRDFYDPSIKRNNIAAALRNPLFQLVEADLSRDFEPALDAFLPPRERLVIYHLAARAGVRKSWGREFYSYVEDNVVATQKLLEWALRRGDILNFIYSSSSSVYGDSRVLPFSELFSIPCPVSPFGVTKLAAEQMVRLYTSVRGLPSVSLRFFTVYGPRQSPGMAFHRFILAVLRGESVDIFGDGTQTRDFTFVSDTVEGLRKAESSTGGAVYNLGGGNRVSLLEAIEVIEEATGGKARKIFLPASPGDARDTLADTTRLDHDLGWKPGVPLLEGIRRETEWIRRVYGI